MSRIEMAAEEHKTMSFSKKLLHNVSYIPLDYITVQLTDLIGANASQTDGFMALMNLYLILHYAAYSKFDKELAPFQTHKKLKQHNLMIARWTRKHLKKCHIDHL